MTKFKGRIYVATSIGLFYLDNEAKKLTASENPKFKQLDLKTECFRFLKAKFNSVERLFVVSHLGLFEIDNSQLDPIFNEYCFFAYQSKSNENKIYVGLKNGLALLTRHGDKWQSEYPENNIKDEIKSIAEDKYGNIWLTSPKDGVYKIGSEYKESFSTKDGTALFESYDTLSGLPDNGLNFVFDFNEDVIFGTLNGIYIYDYKTERFKVDSALSKDVLQTQIYDFNEISKGEYILLSYDSYRGTLILELRKKGDKYENLFAKPFKRLYDSNVNCFYADSLDQLLIGSSLGLINLDLSINKDYNRKFNLHIKSVTVGDDSALFSGTFYQKRIVGADTLWCPVERQDKEFIPRINYTYNSITFKYDYAFYEAAESNQFSCYLEGYETTWKPWSNETKITYSNLGEGTYRFHLKAKNIYDTESDETIYEFIILPPWYRTIWAYLCYAVLAAGFVYLVVQISVRRLKTAKLVLENTVKERTSEIVKQNVEIQKQKDIVEIKNKDITDSINYAKRIQDTILPPDEEIRELLPNSFILFMPKDILSGDFYWLDEVDGKVLVAAVDCTGHGVPGALMSIVGNNILTQSIIEHKISKPSAILDELNKGVTNTLRQKNEESKVKDGMDIVLLAIDRDKMRLEFSGANNPLYHIRNGELTEIK
ncbi:MAG: triple tyrosine motif-containing protein, partial [Bacteroidota bacterium]